MYERLFHVVERDGRLRIISHYDSEPLAPQVTWLHTGGVLVDDPGPVVEVRRLVEPSWEPHLAHWQSMTAAP